MSEIFEKKCVLTHHDTIIYFDAATKSLRHGPVATAPRNVVVAPEEAAARFVLTGHEADGDGPSGFALADLGLTRDGDAVFALETVKDGHVALKNGENYLCAIPNGTFSLDAVTCRAWEKYRLVPAVTLPSPGNNRLLLHAVEQIESDTTAFFLSCNRLDLLDHTIRSFLATRDQPTKMVILDDSAEPGIFETLVARYGAFSDVICFPENRGQWWAMDFMVSYCYTDYIFYVEDDWAFLKTGYLTRSKEILRNHREIGIVDISWRTFEWQGIDSYEKELIENSFYWKKPWRISDIHLRWYGWIGSPNLKRRDDLILLGRIEKWHNEWNIDRKFLALGFKAVFLDGKYVEHLGDARSRMASRRPPGGKTPEDFYPPELQANRRFPKMDYMFLDPPGMRPAGD